MKILIHCQNFNSCTVEVWEFHLTLYNEYSYLTVLGFKLNIVSKRGAWHILEEVVDPNKINQVNR